LGRCFWSASFDAPIESAWKASSATTARQAFLDRFANSCSQLSLNGRPKHPDQLGWRRARLSLCRDYTPNLVGVDQVGSTWAVFNAHPTELFSVVVSGWINVFFLSFVTISLSGPAALVRKALRTAILLTIPFCGIVLYCEHLLPREGHFLWIAGMMLALLSNRDANREEDKA
jgi:hypothetical protein